MSIIPLWYRGEVYAHAIVDAEDFDWIDSYRWTSGPKNRIDARPHRPVRYHKLGSQPMSRELVGMVPRQPGLVHHLNGDDLDNRRENLWVCADSQEHLSLWYGRGSTFSFEEKKEHALRQQALVGFEQPVGSLYRVPLEAAA